MTGTARSPANQRLVQLVGSNCTIDDLLASASAVTTKTLWVPANQIRTASASTLAVFSRVAQGDYAFTRTAGGAETHYFSCRFSLPTCTTSGKGAKITGGRISYELGVVAATTVSATLDQVTYANATPNAVATHGGTLTFDTAHDTNAERVTAAVHLATFTLGTPVFINSATVGVSLELTVVLANTGTLAVNGFGIDFTEFDLGA